MKTPTLTLPHRKPLGERVLNSVGPPIPLTIEEKARVAEAINDEFAKGLISLRKAGAHVEFLSCRNKIRAVWDSIEIVYENDKAKVLVNGLDISDQVHRVQVGIGAGNYPAITIVFGAFPWTINEELDPDEKKRRMQESQGVLETGNK